MSGGGDTINRMKKRAYGFTIVELLIVIVVIAILAAISIIAYRGIQDRANDSSARSAARQAATKLQVAFAENDTYPASLSSIGITNAGSTTYQYKYNNTVSPSTFCVTATTNNKSYYVSNTTTTPTEGGCSGHGQGGQQPITNLAIDPAATGGSANLWTTRYGFLRTWITGATDGPSGGPSTYVRYTAPTGSAGGMLRGIDHYKNIDQAVSAGSSIQFPIQANVPITMSIWVRSSMSNPQAVIAYRIHDGAGNWITPTTLGPSHNYTAGNWVRLVHTFTPTTDGYLIPSTRLNASVSWPQGSTLDATGLVITTGSTTGNYVDGNSPNWDWNGTPDNSTSSGPAL